MDLFSSIEDRHETLDFEFPKFMQSPKSVSYPYIRWYKLIKDKSAPKWLPAMVKHLNERLEPYERFYKVDIDLKKPNN